MFAMMWSFILSRTLVPTMAKYLLHPREHDHGHTPPSRNPLVRFQRGFEACFERFRAGYRDILALAVDHRPSFVTGFIGFIALSFLLVPYLGRNFFPSVDAGQILIHVRTQVGTRIEETARLCDEVEQKIRQMIPSDQLASVVTNIGLPISGINVAYSNTGTIGPSDADILVSLHANHAPTAAYVKQLRTLLPQTFPGTTFAFLPADIVAQILNFGLPAPIDLQVIGT